jgi:hypothetical protein
MRTEQENIGSRGIFGVESLSLNKNPENMQIRDIHSVKSVVSQRIITASWGIFNKKSEKA